MSRNVSTPLEPAPAQLVIADKAKASEARDYSRQFLSHEAERCYECGGRHSHLRCDGSGFAGRVK